MFTSSPDCGEDDRTDLSTTESSGMTSVSSESFTPRNSRNGGGSGHKRMFKVAPVDPGPKVNVSAAARRFEEKEPPQEESRREPEAASGKSPNGGERRPGAKDPQPRLDAKSAPIDDWQPPRVGTSPPMVCRSLPPIRSNPCLSEGGNRVSVAKHRFSTGMIDERDLPRKRVSFGRLSVRKYPIILGDHPDCSCGPPVTIGWQYREYSPVDVEEYELRRPERRNEREMILPYIRRREILTRMSGHTETEIREATKAVRKMQKQRKMTVKSLPFQRMEEVVQSATRGLRKLRPGGGDDSNLYAGSFFSSKEVQAKLKDAAKDASMDQKSTKRGELDAGAAAANASCK